MMVPNMGFFKREQRAITPDSIIAAVNQMRMKTGAPIIDSNSAMRLAAVWACVRLLAGVGSTLPLDQYRDGPGGRTQLPASSLFRAPAPNVNITSWLYQLWSSLLLDGNAYGLVTETGVNGFPVTVEILDPNTVQWRHVDGEWTTQINEKKINRWPNGPLWHMPMFSMPGMPMGQSPINSARQAIGAGISAEQFGAQFFNAGGNPNAIIYSDSELTPEQAQGIKGAFNNATQGNREPAIMGSGLKYERVQISPDESQFLDSQRFTVEQVARIYGVPPEMIGGATSGSSVTYANREQRAADWLSFGLMPYLIPIEDALSTLVPRAQRVKFNVDGLLRSDLSTRYASHAVGISSGFLTVDEARAYEDLPPLTAEDQPLPVDQVIV